MATRSPVTLCSFTSWMRGLSPGATALLMTVRALTWVTERTVAAAIHGRPNRAELPPSTTISSRSRWKPEPFTSIRSFLLTIRLREVGWKRRRKQQCLDESATSKEFVDVCIADGFFFKTSLYSVYTRWVCTQSSLTPLFSINILYNAIQIHNIL